MLSRLLFSMMMLLALSSSTRAQYRSFELTQQGDTFNIVDKEGVRKGFWIISYPEVRGEPGFEEEGEYKKGQKHGVWKQFSLQGDLIGVENYRYGGKEGTQRYFNPLGGLLREENWRAFNPDAPYDTIPIYGEGSNEVVNFKVVKAEPYSVKEGDWKFYDPSTGSLIRTEKWERNNLMNPQQPKYGAKRYERKEGVEKTPEMKEWERKNAGKKGVLRDGATGF
jgi:hypothetical protein